MSQRPVSGSKPDSIECELCILGAGIAGLNALFAASRHLSSSDKVVLVDRNEAPAGMWNHVYGYVRLHQAHPLFTAGNIAWRGQTDLHHLATRAEVIDHLHHCYDVLKLRVQLDPRFGYEYLEHQEAAKRPFPVTITCRRASDGAVLNVRARRLIKAFGYNVQPKAALSLSSQAVRSLSPDSCDLQGSELRDGRSPIYIVGGGKTGMDTAHMLIREMPTRAVRMIIGAGTMFMNRDQLNPRGKLKRHTHGCTALEMFVDIAGRFDGRNEHQVLDYLRRTYCVSLDEGCRRFAFGLLSPDENRTIAQGVDEVVRDHLADVVDTAEGPVMTLRSGARRRIEPGAVFINATGYLVTRDQPYEPYLSRSGHVLSIQPTSLVHFLSSQSSFFLTHLFMLGQLAQAGLYEVDGRDLRDASRDVFGPAAIALTLHNSAKVMACLPRWASAENGLDIMRLYPNHRRLLAVAKLMSFLRRRPDHMRDTLDAVRKRFGIRLGPLAHAT